MANPCKSNKKYKQSNRTTRHFRWRIPGAAGGINRHSRQNTYHDKQKITQSYRLFWEIQGSDKINSVSAVPVTLEKPFHANPELGGNVEQQKGERRQKSPGESQDHGPDGRK